MTLNNNNIIHSYAKWFEGLITHQIHSTISKDICIDNHLKKNGFFITLSFDRNRVAAQKRSENFGARQQSSVEFFNFNHFYNLVCQKLLGRNFMQPKYHSLRPFVIACADAQGTRYGRRPDEIKNIHLHTIWVLHPLITYNFLDHMDEVMSSKQFITFDFSEIDIRSIDSFENRNGGSSKLLTYASKFLVMNTREAFVAEDLQIYPRPMQ